MTIMLIIKLLIIKLLILKVMEWQLYDISVCKRTLASLLIRSRQVSA